MNLVYLAARDKYHVEREDKGGKGYVDFIFYPERKNGGETKVYGKDFSCWNQLQHKDEGAFLQGGSVVEDLQGETSFVLVCLVPL